MAINSTTTPVTEQVTETVDVTVRVPRNTEGTLFDAAETRLGRFTDIVAVTLTASDGIDPRNGCNLRNCYCRPDRDRRHVRGGHRCPPQRRGWC